MTLVEFLAPLKDSSLKDRVLAVLYYVAVVDRVPNMRVSEIRERMIEARVPKARDSNIASVLSRAGHYVDRRAGDGGPASWKLTQSGSDYVEEDLGIGVANGTPTTTTSSNSLHNLISGISDDVARGYLEEAARCLEVRALRAAIVFVWAGAIRTLEEQALAANSPKDVTQAIRKHDPRARDVKGVNDFAHVQDSKELLAFEALEIIDKAERQILEEALGLRNKCGHPTRYRPGEAKLAGYLEDVIGIVYT